LNNDLKFQLFDVNDMVIHG